MLNKGIYYLLANYKVIKYDNGEIEVYDELNGGIPKDITEKIIEYFKKCENR